MGLKRSLQTAGNKIHPHAKRRAFIPCLAGNLEYNVGTQYPTANQNMYALQFIRRLRKENKNYGSENLL